MLTRTGLATALNLTEDELPSAVQGISSVTQDSNSVEPGGAFVAVTGFKTDGLRFAPQALEAGAVLIVAERHWPSAEERASDRVVALEGIGPLPVVVVPNAREALGKLAAAVEGDPSTQLRVHGITGTNGKTTTSYVLYHLLVGIVGAGRVGLSTTAEVIVEGVAKPAVRTTPEAPAVQATLRAMVESGATDVVLETSSHGLELHRVTGVHYETAVFTNLTREHLDIHGDMESYYRTKRILFERATGPRLSNADDEWGHRLATEIPGTLTFGTSEDADYRVLTPVQLTPTGSTFALRTPSHGDLLLQTPLLGSYNALNVAGAVGIALECGHDPVDVIGATRNLAQVPGRFQRVEEAGDLGFTAVVDYAHTEVGLQAVLEVARELTDLTQGRLICIYGAAGERDAAKRPLMGKVVSELADEGIITTDDPYEEDPAAIAEQVLAGADPAHTTIIADRRSALHEAIARARRGDVVIACGKGDETFQHVAGGDVDHHDPTSIREALAQRKRGRA